MHNGVQHPLIGFGTYKVCRVNDMFRFVHKTANKVDSQRAMTQIGFVPASSNTAGVAGHDADQDPKDIIKAAISAGYR